VPQRTIGHHRGPTKPVRGRPRGALPYHTNKEIEMTTQTSFRVNLDPLIHQKAKLKAAITKIPIAYIVREAIRKWVEEEHPIILDSAITPPEEEAQA
jgi:predicted DNA-binding protein